MRESIVGRLLRLYSRLLAKHKYPTQIVTGGVLWFSGDLLCQSLVRLASATNTNGEGSATKDKSSCIIASSWDWHRTLRMTLYGICFSAPTYAFWYSALERHAQKIFAQPPGTNSSTQSSSMAPLLFRGRLGNWFNSLIFKYGGKSSGGWVINETRLRTWKIIGYKLAMDTFIFDPLYLSLFFSVTGAMEGRSIGQIGRKLHEELLQTWLVDISVWTPIQTINFRYVPVLYQALVVQSCNIGWNAYLSFVQHRLRHHQRSSASNIAIPDSGSTSSTDTPRTFTKK